MKTVISELHGPEKSKLNMQEDSTPRDDVPTLPMLWDSLESDTESLVQEKAYQRELQVRIAHNSDLLSVNNSKQEHLDGPQEIKPRMVKGPKTTERHGSLRQTSPEDEYADLRYDPNWRQNLEASLKTRLSLDSTEDSLEHLEDVAVGQRQEYVVVSNQHASEMDTGPVSQPSSPFHLHPRQETSVQDDVLDPSQPKRSCVSSEHTQHSNREHLNIKQKSVGKRSYQHHSDLKQVKAREDIVERNKTTFGVNTNKQGSYLRAHQQKDKLDETKQQSQKERKDPKKRERTNSDQLKPHVPETNPRSGFHLKPLTETCNLSADHLSPTDSDAFPDAPEAYSYSYNPLPHLPPHSNPAPTVNLNINLHSPANHAQPLNHTQQETIYAIVSQALHLERPDLFIPSLLQPGYPYHPSVPSNSVGQGGLAPQAVVPSPTSYSGVVHRKYTVDRNATQGLAQRHDGKPQLNASENASFKNHNRIRIPVLKLPTSPQAESSHYPPRLMPTDETPCAAQAQTSGPYSVLPPIGRSDVSDTELWSDRSEQQVNPIHRSSSEGYLSQMERHIQAKTTYKPYTLKDYKNMRQEVKLGGLGPTNTIPEAMAEKIRRQKLYSNVIREQNKKISRIPSLPAKDPVGTDNKDTVPRRKALEYAKTIAKPKAPPKTIDRPKEKNHSMHGPYLQEMDPVQLATLEMLRRHEEERQAVARFKSVPAI
ncbi:jhy protein homolog isoform X2 [Paramisgurnus dabryanus]|uniref:jhy protein homolog isoform X2 n=1 Tax=Paramisgurnus dabryanus TaxID=90735 RepID=UPI0031F3D594